VGALLIPLCSVSASGIPVSDDLSALVHAFRDLRGGEAGTSSMSTAAIVFMTSPRIV
jgi:hypothetical protein